MKLSQTLRASAAVVAFLVSSPAAFAAAAPINIDDLVPKDLPITLSGSYLAGRGADASRDFSLAIPYYADAFAADPQNGTLGERLVTLALADGQMSAAFDYAEKLTKVDAGDPIALIALASRAIDMGSFDKIPGILSPASDSALGRLTGGLMTAWAYFGQNQTEKGLATIDSLMGPTWYGIFKDYHRALMLDAANRLPEAAAAITKAYQTDATAMQVVLAYARILTRNGERDKAVRALNDYAANAAVQAPVRALLQSLQLGQKPGPVVANARVGSAQVLYGLGVAIGTDQGPELPAVYLRLAALLDPSQDLTVLSLGDVFQATNRFEDAIKVYSTMPANATLKRNADLQISNSLVALQRPQEAAVYAKRVVDANPKDVEAIIQLGNVYRASDRYLEAADAYTKGIEASPGSSDWRILYYRGVSYTMANDWPKAEADFQKALTINPGQPQVLNYLGYSWVDKGLHLDEALAMIKMASDQRPNDGYIVDSLGWAYYRLGRYQEAVAALERAVKLSPQESTLNDHLGDAYWKVGRKLEATFQWAHARDFDPEPAELPKIMAKLQSGLPSAAPGPVVKPN